MFVVILHRKRKAKTSRQRRKDINTYYGDVILTAQPRSTPSTLVALRARLDSTHSWPCSGAAENFSASVASQVP